MLGGKFEKRVKKLSEIAEWLQSFGMGEYASKFEDAKIGPDVLGSLSRDDLSFLNIPLGDQIRILDACQNLPAANARLSQLSVLICDLVDSTKLSHELETEVYKNKLRSFRDICSRCAQRYEGYIPQLRGDSAIVYFGYPTSMERIAVRAAYTALDILAEIARANLSEGLGLEARIGIATGQVLVGTELYRGRTDENAVGDAPNLAARLCSVADIGGVLVCSLSEQLMRNYVALSDVGDFDLKGFAQPARAFKALRKTEASELERLGQSELSVFRGREAELEQLLKIWADSAKRRHIVLIEGEAGGGKSRLLHEFRGEIKSEVGSEIQLNCSDLFARTSLYPIIQQLRKSLDIGRHDKEVEIKQKLDSWLRSETQADENHSLAMAYLLGVRDHQILRALDPDELKASIFSMLTATLKSLISRGKTLLVIEDLHWIDQTTADLLQSILDDPELETASLMILVTCRPLPDSDAALKLAGSHQILLSPLSHPDSLALAREVVDVRKVSPSDLDQLTKRCGGNPLFLEESARAFRYSHLLPQASERVSIPVTLEATLSMRLDQLGAAKASAQVAAVLGVTFDHHIAESLFSTRGEREWDNFESLIRFGLIKIVDPNSSSHIYRFSHALLRDSAYRSLVASERRQLHYEVALLLEAEISADILQTEALAYHFQEAERFDEAARYWLQAGEIACQQSALKQAVVLFQRSLSALELSPSTLDNVALNELEMARFRVDVYKRMAAPLLTTTSYRSPEVRALFQRAISVCQDNQLTDDLPPFYYNIWISEQGDGNHKQALVLARELLQLAEKQTNSAPKVVAHRTVAWSEFNLGNPLKSLEHHEASRALYHPREHKGQLYTYGTDHLIGVGSGQVQALWCSGQQARAREIAMETMRNAEESGHHASLFLAYQFAGCLLHTLCRNWEAVQESAERLISLSTEIPQAGMAGQFYLQTLLVNRDRSLEPARAGLDSIRAAQELGYRFMMPFWMMCMADSCLTAGFTDQASEMLGEAEYILEHTEERWHLAEIYRLQAEIAVKRNDHDVGEALWRRSLEIASGQSALSWELRTLLSIGKHGSRALVQDTRPELLRVLDAMSTEPNVEEIATARAFVVSG